MLEAGKVYEVTQEILEEYRANTEKAAQEQYENQIMSIVEKNLDRIYDLLIEKFITEINNSPQDDRKNYTISINLNPTISTDGAVYPDEIMTVIREHMGELADGIAEELAKKMRKMFNNMPLTKDA